MFFAEMYHMSWFRRALLQVPDLEIFTLIDGKEFTYTCSESLAIIIRNFDIFARVFEVEEAPLDLRYGKLSLLIPYCHGCSKVLIIDTKTKKWHKKAFTYHIDPQENAASKNPLSDIESAVGELSPTVSIFIGPPLPSYLLILNSPSDVEKKKVWAPSGSNSISMP